MLSREKPSPATVLGAQLEKDPEKMRQDFIIALQLLHKELILTDQKLPGHIFKPDELRNYEYRLPFTVSHALRSYFLNGFNDMLRAAGLPYHEKSKPETEEQSPFSRANVESWISGFINTHRRMPRADELNFAIQNHELPDRETIKRLFGGEGLPQVKRRLWAKWDYERQQ